MDAADGRSVPFPVDEYWRGVPVREAVTVDDVSTSRVCIHTDRDGDPVSVDVVLPSGVRIDELLPTIVGLVDDRAPTDGTACWRLQRATGLTMDHSMSLIDNGVRDGEFLILDCGSAPQLGSVRRAACREVVEAPPVVGRLGAAAPDVVGVFVTLLAAAALARTAGTDGAMTYAIVAAAATVAAAVMAVVTGYSTASSIGVVSLAGTTGFLVVPSGPATPNVFLAAAAASSASLSLMRLSGRTSSTLVAASTLSTLTAVVTLISMPLTVAGVALSAAALAVLALAPRLAMLAAGLGPTHGRSDAQSGHDILSGLVAGCAAGVAAGSAVVAIDAAGHPGAAPFTGLVGAVLLLRCRTYADADADRRIAMAVGGAGAIVASLHALFSARPETIAPVACLFVAVGLICARWPGRGAPPSRWLNRLEYTALAAVVPVACWAAGIYTTVGGFDLP